jgi:hypothetical protein
VASLILLLGGGFFCRDSKIICSFVATLVSFFLSLSNVAPREREKTNEIKDLQ